MRVEQSTQHPTKGSIKTSTKESEGFQLLGKWGSPLRVGLASLATWSLTACVPVRQPQEDTVVHPAVTMQTMEIFDPVALLHESREATIEQKEALLKSANQFINNGYLEERIAIQNDIAHVSNNRRTTFAQFINADLHEGLRQPFVVVNAYDEKGELAITRIYTGFIGAPALFLQHVPGRPFDLPTFHALTAGHEDILKTGLRVLGESVFTLPPLSWELITRRDRALLRDVPPPSMAWATQPQDVRTLRGIGTDSANRSYEAFVAENLRAELIVQHRPRF